MRDIEDVTTISPCGVKIATTGYRGIRILDVDSGEELQKLEGHSFAFVPDGTKIVTLVSTSTSLSNSIRVWNTESGEELRGLGGSRI